MAWKFSGHLYAWREAEALTDDGQHSGACGTDWTVACRKPSAPCITYDSVHLKSISGFRFDLKKYLFV